MQMNGFDCGVFMCAYTERIARRQAIDFSQTDIPNIRIEMARNIRDKQIQPVVSRRQRPPASPATPSMKSPLSKIEKTTFTFGKYVI